MKYLQYNLHNKFDKYNLKTSQIIVVGIALRDRVVLIFVMVPLEVVCKSYMCFWMKHNLVRPNLECESGCAVLVEHIHLVFLSLNTYVLFSLIFLSVCSLWHKGEKGNCNLIVFWMSEAIVTFADVILYH